MKIGKPIILCPIFWNIKVIRSFEVDFILSIESEFSLIYSVISVLNKPQ